MEKGFTLIELMIIVAICGILAAIAIPKLREMSGPRRHKMKEVIYLDGVKYRRVE